MSIKKYGSNGRSTGKENPKIVVITTPPKSIEECFNERRVRSKGHHPILNHVHHLSHHLPHFLTAIPSDETASIKPVQFCVFSVSATLSGRNYHLHACVFSFIHNSTWSHSCPFSLCRFSPFSVPFTFPLCLPLAFLLFVLLSLSFLACFSLFLFVLLSFCLFLSFCFSFPLFLPLFLSFLLYF